MVLMLCRYPEGVRDFSPTCSTVECGIKDDAIKEV
ncbi:hypothetical protein Barb7_03026 [Bacteroidales bacterium Barb7]|nr:hypothetical protein Barb7_03026 [Bacteroidales bacterium Barb7]